MLEKDFQKTLIKKIKERYPDSIILKNDAKYFTSIPDWIVLYRDKWAMLECKRSEQAYEVSKTNQPAQHYWVGVADDMSFARFAYPENMDQVLFDLESYFEGGTNHAVS